jgi:hypothetical protein
MLFTRRTPSSWRLQKVRSPLPEMQETFFESDDVADDFLFGDHSRSRLRDSGCERLPPA